MAGCALYRYAASGYRTMQGAYSPFGLDADPALRGWAAPDNVPPSSEVPMGSQTRVRKKAIYVWVKEDEKEQIESNAKACNKSASSFLRDLGMGYVPKSMIDHDAVGDLMQLNGDLGRLGGLLKMWLTNDEDFRGREGEMLEVTTLLSRINELREEIREKVRSV